MVNFAKYDHICNQFTCSNKKCSVSIHDKPVKIIENLMNAVSMIILWKVNSLGFCLIKVL